MRALLLLAVLAQSAPAPPFTLPSAPLAFGAFTARFDPAGTFTLDGQGWPSMGGTFTLSGNDIALC